MDALYQSAKTGKPVKLSKPPLPVEPKGSKTANAALARMVQLESVVSPC